MQGLELGTLHPIYLCHHPSYTALLSHASSDCWAVSSRTGLLFSFFGWYLSPSDKCLVLPTSSRSHKIIKSLRAEPLSCSTCRHHHRALAGCMHSGDARHPDYTCSSRRARLGLNNLRGNGLISTTKLSLSATSVQLDYRRLSL